jgi:Flp pilus assembly pilin Flp
MNKRMIEGFNSFIRDESGQAVTEYGAVLALTAVIVAIVFVIANSPLKTGISAAYSAIASQLNNLSENASSGSGS